MNQGFKQRCSLFLSRYIKVRYCPAYRPIIVLTNSNLLFVRLESNKSRDYNDLNAMVVNIWCKNNWNKYAYNKKEELFISNKCVSKISNREFR